MKFTATILGSLLAASAIAAPRSKSGIASRMERRGHRDRQSAPISKSETKEKAESAEYSQNWSGVIIETPPTGETWKNVTGTFIVPTPSAPSGSSGSSGSSSSSSEDYWAASVWVGIDGDTCATAILQTGVDLIVSSDGELEFDAWYEWYPDYASDFDLTISAGDTITTTVEATTLTKGTAMIENVTTGKVASITLTSSSSLCGENAEWILEDFQSGTDLVPFADFGTVTYTDCAAMTAESTEGITGATTIDIKSTEGTVLTSVDIESASKVVISYSG